MSELSTGRNSTKLVSHVIAAIFDNLDRIDENFFAYTRVDGKDDILNLVLDDNGKFDPMKASNNVLVCEVDRELVSPLKSEFVKSGVPFAWQSYIEPAKADDELAKVHNYLVFPKSEEITVNSTIDDFIRMKPERNPMEPSDLLHWIMSNEEGSTKAAGLEIDKDLYDYINRAGLLSVPRTELGEDTINNTVRLRMPWDMGDGVLATVKMAEVLYTADFRRIEEECSEKLRSTLENTVSKAKDDQHNCVIVNKEAPSQYIRLDRDGYRFFIDTQDGPNLIAIGNRKDRDYEQSFYNILRTFGDYRELEGREKDTAEKLREIQEQKQQVHGISTNERVYKLKQEHIEDFMRACEIIGSTYQRASNMEEHQYQRQVMDKSRMKDDVIKIENRMDELRSMGLGNSTAAGDLRGDLVQIKGMIMSSISNECTKDLSDVYDVKTWEDYLTNKLCLDVHSEEYKKDTLEQFKDMIEHVANEAPEVQEAFRKELSDTIREVFDHEYRYQTESLSLEDVDLRQEIQIHQRESELVVTR